jgi:hypothetical protein
MGYLVRGRYAGHDAGIRRPSVTLLGCQGPTPRGALRSVVPGPFVASVRGFDRVSPLPGVVR